MNTEKLIKLFTQDSLADLAKLVGKALKDARLSMQFYNPAQLAETLGLDQQIIESLEAGDTSVWKNTGTGLDVLLNRICRSLSLTLDEVVPRFDVSSLSKSDRDSIVQSMKDEGWFIAAASHPGASSSSDESVLQNQIELYVFFNLVSGLSRLEKAA